MALKSKCCGAKVKVCGIGDFNDSDRICTCHYECVKCGEDCDTISVERKTWNRNPATQIVPNKKKKQVKLTKQEIDKFRREEDF